MSINMNILHALEQLRIPFLEYIFLGITHLGAEAVSAVAAFAIYWCVSKREGLFVIANCLIGSGVNQIVKLVCHVPRPFVQYEDFDVVEKARATTGGFSFPSGHTQNSTSLYGSIAVISKRLDTSSSGDICSKRLDACSPGEIGLNKPDSESSSTVHSKAMNFLRRKGVRIFFAVMIVLVAFSRLYLGAHYPTDVMGGFVCGLIILVLMSLAFRGIEQHPNRISLIFGIGAAAMIVALLVFETESWQKTLLELTDPEALRDMLKGIAVCAGCSLAVAVCEPIERKCVRFETDALWWAQILKTVIGLALVVALALIMKYPTEAIFGTVGVGSSAILPGTVSVESSSDLLGTVSADSSTIISGMGTIGYVIRFFVPAAFGICVWPLSFKLFPKGSVASTP